jgi:heme/copper-type cytochrome/quinol oxidase subunit 3
MSTATTVALEHPLDRGKPPASPPRRGNGGDPPRPPQGGAAAPPIANGQIAILAFILFESMLFAGLLGGFSVYRFGTRFWPPPGQPYLPIGVTWVNTFVLLGSLVPLTLARRAQRRAESRRMAPLLASTALCGAAFLAIQGTEWVRLLAHGMKVGGGVYGGIFILLIGTHGLHVLGAVAWLAVLAIVAMQARTTMPLSSPSPEPAAAPGRASIGAISHTALSMAATYWWFVCAVWVVLFGLVYLA